MFTLNLENSTGDSRNVKDIFEAIYDNDDTLANIIITENPQSMITNDKGNTALHILSKKALNFSSGMNLIYDGAFINDHNEYLYNILLTLCFAKFIFINNNK